jgi:hypothetical protein
LGDKLCLTDVPFALEGWPVNVTDESGTEIAAVVDESATARTRPPRPPAGGGGIGSAVDWAIAAGGDKLPSELKAKLEDLKTSKDFSKMRPVMGEFREWAEANDIEMPAGGGGRGGRGGGGGGRGGF